ncbi:hypothetical protein [Paenibacillus sinopodophylli]|uniref:hypothetical protein n=1 Tax=Paenibacillus sinopodophylli TaxID=1837342 RepID=UPI00110CA409|nr:hypothetical protein [Paenibacillus sinopodophylli]
MKFLREPMVFPLKMFVIYFGVKICILYFNDMEFTFRSEFLEAIGVAFLLLLAYAVASVVPFNDQHSSPLIIQESLLRKIKSRTQYIILEKYRGVYNMPRIKFVDEKLCHTYTAIDSPEQLIVKIDAYIDILCELNTGSADRYIKKLENLRTEARYMMLNQIQNTVNL